MFNNPFLKKDPLVEAVKQAQRDGDLRRQAVALVNEAFGVYSRNAVIREELAAYDAAVEEAYKCMREGDVENIMNPKSQWAQKQAADKNNPFNQPTPNPTEVAPNIMMKGPTQSGSSSIADKVKSLFKEGKPLDPVGREDKDIDNDGDHDKTDKYLLHRRAVRSKAIKEDDVNKMRVGDPAVTDTLKKNDNVPLMTVADPKGLKTAFTAVRQSKGMPIDDLKEGSAYNGKNPFDPKDPSVQRGSSEFSDSKATSYDKTLPKEYPGAASSAPTANRLRNAGGLKENQLDEISKGLVGRYINKNAREREYLAGKDEKLRVARDSVPAGIGHSKETSDLGWKMRQSIDKETENVRKAQWKRSDGMHNAVKKLTGKAKVPANEETLSEISKDRLQKYSKAAQTDTQTHYDLANLAKNKDDFKYHQKKAIKRSAGYLKAQDKLAKEEVEQLDEISRETKSRYIEKAMEKAREHRAKGYTKAWKPKKGAKAEHEREMMNKRTAGISRAAKNMEEDYQQIDEVKWSHKAARRGEDIGKPGETFSKIEKSAAERYGSEEAGKRVAGSILAKLRAKHMKEDSSFNAALHQEGKSVNEVAMTAPAIEPPAIHGPRVPGQKVKQSPNLRTGATGRLTGQYGTMKPSSVSGSTSYSQGGTNLSRGMSQAGRQAAATRASTLGGMNPADKIASMATKGSSGLSTAAGTLARYGARALGPVGALVGMTAPAGAGEDEKARQAQYGQKLPNVAPGQGSTKNVAPVTGGSIGADVGRTTRSRVMPSGDVTPRGGANIPTGAGKSAAEKVGIPQRPTTLPRADFAKGKDVSKTPLPTAQAKAPAAKPSAPTASGKVTATAQPSTAKPTAGQSFSQAFRAAREAAKSAGKDPNIAQFKWTSQQGKEGTYQAATSKSQYVAPSKQFKTSVGVTPAKAEPAKEPAAGTATPQPTAVRTTSSVPALAGGQTAMKMPSDLAGRDQEQDKAVADVTARGIRNRSASTGEVDPTKFPAPGSTGDPRGRATGLPSVPAPTTSDVTTGLPKNVKQTVTPLRESVVVGNYKYRIV